MTAKWTVTQADAFAALRALPDESVDLVITDPPYESLEKHRSRGTTTRLTVSDASSNPWFEIMPNARFPDLFREVWRVLKPDAHFYMFCDFDTMRWLLERPGTFEACGAPRPRGGPQGFTLWKPIVWDKQAIGMGYHYRNQTERVLFFEKGKRKLNDLGMSDLRSHKRIRRKTDDPDYQPTEKPVALLRELVEQSTEPGDLVVDPFCGSGSTGVACLLTGRRFAGSDKADRSVALTERRLRALWSQT